MHMKDKILIIGQAPPAVKQSIPYDTTMLYETLSWVNISVDDAQNMFDFDAVYDKFPGYNAKGHITPTQEQMEEYWSRSLRQKVINSQKIIVFGKVAENFIRGILPFGITQSRWLFMMHPSRINYFRIKQNQDIITGQLERFLKEWKK